MNSANFCSKIGGTQLVPVTMAASNEIIKIVQLPDIFKSLQ